MNLFEVAVASKLSGGGGGGSSDFSTAEVTVFLNPGFFLYVPYIVDEGSEYDSIVGGGITDNDTYTVPLFKGQTTGFLDTTDNVEVTGDCTYYDGDISITGNCTITFSDK